MDTIKEPKNQTEWVLKHLKDNDSITSWEAITEYGATRLSDIIFRLRDKGHGITAEPFTVTNRYGRKINVARYKLNDKSR